MKNSSCLLRFLLVTVFLALTIQSVESAINLEKRNQLVSGAPATQPTGAVAQKVKSLKSTSGSSFKSQCSVYLAQIHSLTMTKTSTVKTTTTLAAGTTTVPVTITNYNTVQTDTITISPPEVTSTVVSTETQYSLTSTPVTEIDSTSTVIPDATTTTVTSTGLVASPTISGTSAQEVSKRTTKPPPGWNYPILEEFYKEFGPVVLNDACLYVVYGSHPVPTSIITTTKTFTNTPAQVTISSTSTATVNTDVQTTITLPTVTVTESDSETVTTLSVAPTSTFYSTTTTTEATVTSTVTDTVPPSQITGYFVSSNGNVPMYEYSDSTGTHITDEYNANGIVYGQVQGQQGVYVYDVASQGFQDCTGGSCTSNFMGAHDGQSFIFMGTDPYNSNNPLLIQCTLASVLNGPLQCTLQNGISSGYQFFDCPSTDHAQFFMDPQSSASHGGCNAVSVTFMPTSFS